MSHFSTIQTKIVVKEYLKKALDDLKFKWEEGDLEVVDYYGAVQKVEIKLSQHNIGFRKQNQSYDIVADWWGKNIKQEEFVQNVTQRYAYNSVKGQLEQDGFTFVEDEVLENNTIHLSVRRMT